MSKAGRPFVLASQLGLTMGLTSVAFVLGGLFLGRWLDKLWGTQPAATLTLLFAGAVASSLTMYQQAREALEGLMSAPAMGEQTQILSWRKIGVALALAVKTTLAVSGPALVGLWLGIRIDRAVGTQPIVTIVLVTLGTIGGFVAMFAVARRSARAISDTMNR